MENKVIGKIEEYLDGILQYEKIVSFAGCGIYCSVGNERSRLHKEICEMIGINQYSREVQEITSMLDKSIGLDYEKDYTKEEVREFAIKLYEKLRDIKFAKQYGVEIKERDYLEDGERNADYFNINVWRGQAENCEKYLKKGSKIAVLGSLHNRSYDDKDGNRKTVTEITASEIEFLSSIRSEEAQAPEQLRLEEVSDDEPLPF